MDERPERIEMPGRKARVVSQDGFAGRAILSEYEWQYDEPPEKGGGATAPAPVAHLLGSLSACFAVTVRTEASKHDVPIQGLDVRASAHPETGFIEEIDLEAFLSTELSGNDVQPVVTHSEQNCNILQLIREDVPVTLDWDTSHPDGTELP